MAADRPWTCSTVELDWSYAQCTFSASSADMAQSETAHGGETRMAMDARITSRAAGPRGIGMMG
jgi:hypothetical protein